jgi:cation:H+ antiporter
MDLHPALVFLAGLVVLVLGADFILRGATRIAAMSGVRPIIIGLTIVSVGTSLPELAVGITAVSEGRGSLAVGNIAGTNILNILFILGLSAAIRPLPLQLMSLRLDVPVMMVSSVVIFLMALDGVLSQLEGGILVLSALVYTVALVRLSKKESAVMRREFAEEFSKEVLLEKPGLLAGIGSALLLVAGMGLTILGAEFLVKGSVSIASSMGVSDAVIGLTIVAIGTSAPELVTTMVATVKDDRDVAIGNLIGSSISNILVILGVTCLVAPDGVEVTGDVLWFDLPLAAAVAIACYPVFRSDRMVSRPEGLIFVSLYLVYMVVLILFRI